MNGNKRPAGWMASDDDMNNGWDRVQTSSDRQGVWDVNNMRKRMMQWAVVAALGVMALAGGRVARADGPDVVTDLPAVQIVADAGAGDPTTDGMASFAFPMVYLSSPDTGNVQGTGYADEDIMRYNSGANTWTKVFDGTNAGLPDAADIDALTLIINSGYISFLMSFDTPTAVPGLGTIDDSDVARYDTWNGQWSLYLDGSAHGLTTDGEDIDALTFSPGGFLVVSTSGAWSVKNLGGGTAKGADEDLFSLVNPATSEWTLWLDGTTLGLQGTNDIRGVSFGKIDDGVVDSARYLVPQSAFTLPNGVSIGANDVSEQVWFENGFTDTYKKYDNSGIGFPKIDAIEVVK